MFSVSWRTCSLVCNWKKWGKYSGGARMFAARNAMELRLISCKSRKKTAAHTFCTYLCWNKVMSPIRQKPPNFRIPYFCPSKCRALHGAARGRCPRSPPPRSYWENIVFGLGTKSQVLGLGTRLWNLSLLIITTTIIIIFVQRRKLVTSEAL